MKSPITSERKLLSIARSLIKKWKSILLLDPIWSILVEVQYEEEMDGAVGRIDTGRVEYFSATIEISDVLMYFEEEDMLHILETLICHELIHLVMVDFFRTAKLAAGKSKEMHEEINYKYEQFTSRLQQAFLKLNDKNEKVFKKLKSFNRETKKRNG